MFTLLLTNVTQLMPAMSSEGICDALQPIICTASDEQQQLGTVSVAALVLHKQGACMNGLVASINKDMNIQ